MNKPLISFSEEMYDSGSNNSNSKEPSKSDSKDNKKKRRRCKTCNKKVPFYVTPCDSCDRDVCLAHNQYEMHDCAGINKMREAKKKRLIDTLEERKCVGHRLEDVL